MSDHDLNEPLVKIKSFIQIEILVYLDLPHIIPWSLRQELMDITLDPIWIQIVGISPPQEHLTLIFSKDMYLSTLELASSFACFYWLEFVWFIKHSLFLVYFCFCLFRFIFCFFLFCFVCLYYTIDVIGRQYVVYSHDLMIMS